MTTLNDSPIAFLVRENLAHIARGNVIKMVTKTRSGADKDLGIAGTVTETIVDVVPEPYVNAVPVPTVQRSGGAFRYSDLKMTVAKTSMTFEQAMSLETGFDINGERYQILTPTAGPSAYEFIVRKETAEPVIP